MRQFRRDIQEKIAAALDPERRAKYKAMIAEDREGGAPTDGGTPGRVYILGPEGVPLPIALRLGATDGTYTEVLVGDLQEGAAVIVGGGPRQQSSAAETPPTRPRGPRLF